MTEHETDVTPESAGWGFTGLRILALGSGKTDEFDTGADEMIVLPLAGGADLTADDQSHTLHGRADVFAGPTDALFVPPQTSVAITSAAGGRFALCAARTDQMFPIRYLPAPEVAGRAARCGPVQPSGPQLRHTRRPGRGRDHRLRGDHAGRQLVLLPGAQARRGE